uniref:Uncharacterized protein n=1 Tax=Mustela putorius furo TaxID=9669 RepID=M3YL79_MUSPF
MSSLRIYSALAERACLRRGRGFLLDHGVSGTRGRFGAVETAGTPRRCSPKLPVRTAALEGAGLCETGKPRPGGGQAARARACVGYGSAAGRPELHGQVRSEGHRPPGSTARAKPSAQKVSRVRPRLG